MSKKSKLITLLICAAGITAGTYFCSEFASKDKHVDVESKIVNAIEYRTGITYQQLFISSQKFAGRKLTLTGTVVGKPQSKQEAHGMCGVLQLAVDDDPEQIIKCIYPFNLKKNIQEGDEIAVLGIFIGRIQGEVQAYGTTLSDGLYVTAADMLKEE
ncbi:hypothetical protein IJT93_09875 [bacterium]|nr:hypothetical protein [bacterium]